MRSFGRTLVLCWFLVAASVLAADQVVVQDTAAFTHPKLGLTVVRGSVDLPAEGIWTCPEPGPEAPLRQVHLIPPEEALQQTLGRRIEEAERQRKNERGRSRLRRFWQALADYARAHDGVGPVAFSDVDGEKYSRRIEQWQGSPWAEDRERGVAGPYAFLIPNVPFDFDPETDRPSRRNARPLVLELRPYVDDGKHWVLFTDRRCVRQEIDAELVKRYDLTISPVWPAQLEETPARAQTYRYTVAALTNRGAGGSVKLMLGNAVTREETACLWDFSEPAPGEAELLAEWAGARARRWLPLVSRADAPVLRAWLARHEQLYGTEAFKRHVRDRRARRTTTNVFNVLGGRAAVRETLQMQVLGPPEGKPKQDETVAVVDIHGVEVKSHPFEEMLMGRTGGRLPLADCVPPDRFFVYLARPGDTVDILDRSGDFLSDSGAALTWNSIRYDLKARYLARLGLTEQWVRMFLGRGIIKELALVFPDLFFIDGTEVTAIARISQLRLVRPMLQLIGLGNLSEDAVLALPLPTGDSVYWALSGDLLFAGTNRQELQRVVALHKNGGLGSLGRSAEFRYMLEQLPVEKETVAYVYFSDPFIRRMVGPQTKIAQLRRMQARAELEALSAGALLFKADGQPGPATLARLVELGYVPEAFAGRDYVLREDLVAQSKKYATPARLKSLLENPVETVTEEEAKAYKRYVRNYSRFWRRFFDPIAMRLDDTGEGAELTTFILPLLDSRLYDQVREVLANAEDGVPLRVPELTPKPVLMCSLNLGEKAWLGLTKGLYEALAGYTHIDPVIIDYLGPAVHLAVGDTDPIISLGSGDILGAFGGDVLEVRGAMMAIPPALSLLTRPSKVLVELKDEEKVLDILRRRPAVDRPLRRERGFQVEFYKLEDRDAWVCTLSVMGLVKLRYGISVENGYLVISNMPWSQRTGIGAVRPAPLNGALLRLNPGEVESELAALFMTAGEQQRAGAVQGIGYLYPLLLSASKTPEEAAAQHARLFGFTPVHPGPGEWMWQGGEIESTAFGNIINPRQPSHKPSDREFGLLRGLGHLSLNMQLEETGLRARLHWVRLPQEE